jgi:hypothetical protein
MKRKRIVLLIELELLVTFGLRETHLGSRMVNGSGHGNPTLLRVTNLDIHGYLNRFPSCFVYILLHVSNRDPTEFQIFHSAFH